MDVKLKNTLRVEGVSRDEVALIHTSLALSALPGTVLWANIQHDDDCPSVEKGGMHNCTCDKVDVEIGEVVQEDE